MAGGVRVGLQPLTGTGPATATALLVLVALTGALHLDGLADFADAIGVRGDKDRRLEVMRQSTIGTFGALALVLWALLVWSSLASLTAGHALLTLIAAGTLSRAAALLHARLSTPARPDGLGAAVQVGTVAVVMAVAIPVVAALILLSPPRAAVAAAATAVIATVMTAASKRWLGGQTGDTLGATISLTEAVVCLTLVATWH